MRLPRRAALGLAALALPAVARAQPFPEPGKPVTVIVPFPPGGGNDISMRALAPVLERELGTSVVILNRAGAGSQLGMTQLARSRPDGYTLGYALWPSLIPIYLDPARQAAFDRHSFTPLAMHIIDPNAIAVRGVSPFRSFADLLAAARARPEELRASTNGLMGLEHLALLQLQRAFDLKLNVVHFQGAGPAVTALLGGHIDLASVSVGTSQAYMRDGSVRLLAVLDEAPSEFAPGVPTLASLGADLRFGSSRGFVGPAGMAPALVERLGGVLERAITSPEHVERTRGLGLPIRFMGPATFGRCWDDMEASVRPLVEQALREGTAN